MDWEAQQAEAARRRQEKKERLQQDIQDRFARVLQTTKVDLEIEEVADEDTAKRLNRYKRDQTSDLDRILAEAEAARAKARYGTDKS